MNNLLPSNASAQFLRPNQQNYFGGIVGLTSILLGNVRG